MADNEFPLEAPNPMADPLFAAVSRIAAATYTATSADGAATVVVGGDQRVRSVQVLRSDNGPLRVGVAINQATNAALELARRGSVEELQQLEGLGETLQRGLDGEDVTR
ncbi:MAG: YbaB/EbfC family nucleoid-associated protein [Propionibacteriaceae bacterium]